VRHKIKITQPTCRNVTVYNLTKTIHYNCFIILFILIFIYYIDNADTCFCITMLNNYEFIVSLPDEIICIIVSPSFETKSMIIFCSIFYVHYIFVYFIVYL